LSVCTALFKLHMALLKKVVSPRDCKITKAANVGNAAV